MPNTPNTTTDNTVRAVRWGLESTGKSRPHSAWHLTHHEYVQLTQCGRGIPGGRAEAVARQLRSNWGGRLRAGR